MVFSVASLLMWGWEFASCEKRQLGRWRPGWGRQEGPGRGVRNGPSRKRSWRQEIVDVGSGSACGEYSHCWSCRSFSFTFETWHKQLHTNEFLSGFLAD